jgi:hypothetical protein
LDHRVGLLPDDLYTEPGIAVHLLNHLIEDRLKLGLADRLIALDKPENFAVSSEFKWKLFNVR